MGLFPGVVDRVFTRQMLARKLDFALRSARLLRSLRSEQVRALVRIRLRGSTAPHRRLASALVRRPLKINESIPKKVHVDEAGAFEFLGRAKCFRGPIDWQSADMPLLWRYNLHYFEYVLDSHLSPQWIAATIDDWIAQNELGKHPAWAPYVASVRAVAWIKLFARIPELGASHRLESLYRHGLWLERNLERHLLANHYLKNGQALLLLGACFEGADSDRWLAVASELIRTELQEQFLSDGGHFERSPMYHALIVEDLLDLLNAASALMSRELHEPLVETARRALDHLWAIVLPDGEIPLLNDAAFGVAAAPAELFAYGMRLGIWKQPARASRYAEALDATGLYVMREGDDMLIVDCGEMGPCYQPGHAHADTLSYELVLRGRRVVVDSGVFDYEPTAERLAIRGTPAHNTIVVDEADQSELWGTFRVGKRARPLHARLSRDEGAMRFVGAHDGYRRLGDEIVHQRTIEYDGTTWRIVDEVFGKNRHTIDSMIHLAPGLRTELRDRAVRLLDPADRLVAEIVASDGVTPVVEPSLCYPRFGIREPNVRVRLRRNASLPIRLSYSIVPASEREHQP